MDDAGHLALGYNQAMNSPDPYIEIREGGYYIPGSRVSLSSIISVFAEGASPETIRENFPTLTLAQVYGALAFYLNHPEECEAYLRENKRLWEELEKKAEAPSGERLKRIEEARQRLLAGR
jgi:uncharacterized protein (DUF433 family)